MNSNMNINQKLNEKFRMFEEIDKQVISESNKGNDLIDKNKQTKRMFIGDYKVNENKENIETQKKDKSSNKIINFSQFQTLNQTKSKSPIIKEPIDKRQNRNLRPASFNQITNNLKNVEESKCYNEFEQSQSFSKYPQESKRNKQSLIDEGIELLKDENKQNSTYFNNFNYKNFYSNPKVDFENSQSKNNFDNKSQKPTYINNQNKPPQLPPKKEKLNTSNSKNLYTNSNASRESSPSGILKRNEDIKKMWEEKKQKNIPRPSYTPTITEKARRISRDPEKFSERLYPSHTIKNKSNDSFDIVSTNSPCNNRDNIEQVQKIYRKNKDSNYEKHSYKPELNKKSLRLADKLESPKSRLTKNSKKSFQSNNNIENVSRSRSKKSFDSTLNHCNSLHDIHKKRLKERESLLLKKKSEAEKSIKDLSFKPKLISRSKDKSNSTNRSRNNSTNTYDRLVNWEKSKNNKTNKIKQLMSKREDQQCTFKPDVKPNNVVDDEDFINKNKPHIEKYIARQKKIMEKKKEDEIIYKKKFSSGENYTIKKTIPKEFNLLSGKNKADNNAKGVHLNQDLTKMRTIMKTEHFFDNSKASVEFSRGINEENSFDNYNMENQFAEAVNYLHEQLYYN